MIDKINKNDRNAIGRCAPSGPQKTLKTLSPPRGGWGGRKRKRAGHDGKGPFPSFHRPPHAFYYFSILVAIFIGKPRGSLFGGESERHVTIRNHSTLLTMIEVQGYKHARFKS